MLRCGCDQQLLLVFNKPDYTCLREWISMSCLMRPRHASARRSCPCMQGQYVQLLQPRRKRRGKQSGQLSDARFMPGKLRCSQGDTGAVLGAGREAGTRHPPPCPCSFVPSTVLSGSGAQGRLVCSWARTAEKHRTGKRPGVCKNILSAFP